MKCTIGVDVGGTFTDIVLASDEHGLLYSKVPSTRDVATGVLNGIETIIREIGLAATAEPLEIVHFHGTTVATNTILEATGARIGLITTRGHEDVVAIGRQKRPHLYDLFFDKDTPDPLIPRDLRIGIDERVGGRGEVVRNLQPEEVLAAARRLVEADVSAIAVCLLNSHVNPVHEQAVKALINERHPGMSVSLSSSINPVFREYERTVVTVFDAYVRPLVEGYLTKLGNGLRQSRRSTMPTLSVMQSRGGTTSARLAIEKPVSLILSGPAGGVIAGKFIGELAGRDHLITMDTGGTSTDISVLAGGDVPMTKDGRVGKYPLRLPMVDIHTIAAGGGSIAWVDAGGGVRVGPASAGATPGPACYDQGGTEPTITDASVVLGYIDPDFFAKGALKLAPGKAFDVIRGFAQHRGLDLDQAALGIHAIQNAHIAEAIKLVTVKRGVDPRRFSLLAFGGGGAIHAASVARMVGIPEVIVPRQPGTLSALGLLASNIEFDGVKSVISEGEADAARYEGYFRELEAAGVAALAEEGIKGRSILHRRSLDMRYVGQSYDIEIGIAAPFDHASISEARAAFHKAHDAIYGHSDLDRQTEIINLRSVSFQQPNLISKELVGAAASGNRSEAAPRRRSIAFPEGRIEAPVYARGALRSGVELAGPCLIEQEDTTIVVLAGQRVALDPYGNILIST
jgi:N-methylhydantoinase A